MAKLLTQEIVNAIHQSLETEYPLNPVRLADLQPYYRAGDYSQNCFDNADMGDFDGEATVALLILAAEEELDDYPMEAVSE